MTPTPDDPTPRARETRTQPGWRVGMFVRWIDDRSFGFIVDATQTEYFVHLSAFDPSVDRLTIAEHVGRAVRFRGMETPKGLRAANVIWASDEEAADLEESYGNQAPTDRSRP